MRIHSRGDREPPVAGGNGSEHLLRRQHLKAIQQPGRFESEGFDLIENGGEVLDGAREHIELAA